VSGRTPILLALAGLAALLIAVAAQAAGTWKFQLTSSDGGQSNTGTLKPNQVYEILCDIPAVYQTSAAAPVVDRTKDKPAPSRRRYDNGAIAEPIPQPIRFSSGPHVTIAAFALDGGNPACNVWYEQGDTSTPR
jgi:hypothetical protein